MITKTVGGDRLGSGNKLTTKLHGYERSTHDLGRITRTTMTQGTIVPIFCEFGQKGDVWDIDLESLIRTHPTNGPIFGTYKFQVDVFTSDVRLYNKQLHNNTTGIGMSMKNVIFPRMRLNADNPSIDGGDLNQQQIAPDSLLAYLGIRGLGTGKGLAPNDTSKIEIFRNAMPLMSYWDIYKEYYSNKQEEIGVVIDPEPIFETEEPEIIEFNVIDTYGNKYNILEAISTVTEIPIHNGYSIEIIGERLNKLQYIGEVTYPGQTTAVPVVIDQWPGLWENIYISEDATKLEYINYGYRYQEYTPIRLNRNSTTQDWLTWNGTTYGTTQRGITLKEFPLSNIDDMREAVFAQDKTSPLTIGYYLNEHSYLPYGATVGQTRFENGTVLSDSKMRSYYTMAGLGIKTYQSDRFNNWLSSTWIDSINSISSVSTTTGSFTMDALNLAKKVYMLENRIAVSGATYQDWLEAVYGEKTGGAPEMPVYRGGMSSEIVFDEVISSSDATTQGGADQPLGTLGGRGTQKGKKGGSIRFMLQEHGYIIILASITPRIDYYQGNKWHFKLETMDDIHKPQLDSIGFQNLLTDEAAAWDTNVNSGIEEFHAFGKQPSWTHYTTNWNEVYGNFARQNAEQWMTLTRRYEPDENGNIKDATTYIDPTKFNYPFAYLPLENQPFWVQVGIDAIVRRKMSAVQMPNL